MLKGLFTPSVIVSVDATVYTLEWVWDPFSRVIRSVILYEKSGIICWVRGFIPRGDPSPWHYVVLPQNNSNHLAPMQFELVFCSPLPLGARSKSLVKTKSVQVSPPPECRTTTPCTFTERQKAFIGPHHQTKISRQKTANQPLRRL